jgi:hypothetical protein
LTDNVVYIGKHSQPTSDDNPAETTNAAVREAFLEALRSFRAGETRATLILSFEKDGSVTWRAGGLATDFEIIAALERTKMDWLINS